MLRASLFPDRRFLPVSALLLLALADGGLAGPWAVMDLAVTDTARIVFASEPGKVYQLLASTDLKDWPAAADPVYGTGETMELWPLSQANPSGHQFFKVRIDTEPTGGSAPWKLSGTPLLLNEGDRSVRYDFAADGSGSWKSGDTSRPFTWTWLRNGLNSGKVTVNWTEGGRQDLTLEFSERLLGRFTRDEWTDGLLVKSDAGTFGGLPADSSPATPAALAGRKIVLADGATGSLLNLDTANSGSRVLDGSSRPVTYSWLVTGGGNITLTANISATHGEEYRLDFRSPQCGKFVRRTFTEGVFRDEDAGAFTLSDSKP